MTARRVTVTRSVLIAVIVVAFVGFSVTSRYFLSADNMINLLNDVALTGIVAMPATFLIMTGQVDISIGATAAFSGIILAATAPDVGLPTAVLLAAGTGLAVGIVNGLLVTVAGVESIATTFGSMALLRGLAYLVPSGLAIAVPGFRTLGNAAPVLGITVPTLIFAAAVALAGILSSSRAGRRARDIGATATVSRFDHRGEQVWVFALFCVSGLAAALVGLIRTSQLGTGLPTVGIGMELTVVAAVLLGGGCLTGGRGSVLGTMLVLLAISIIDNGMSLANITAYAGQVFHAALLMIALVIDRPRRHRLRYRSAEADAHSRRAEQHLETATDAPGRSGV